MFQREKGGGGADKRRAKAKAINMFLQNLRNIRFLYEIKSL
jgi:hypothetical protein